MNLNLGLYNYFRKHAFVHTCHSDNYLGEPTEKIMLPRLEAVPGPSEKRSAKPNSDSGSELIVLCLRNTRRVA
jgi:hypothetical protein